MTNLRAGSLVVIAAAGWAFFMERPAPDDASTVSATAGSVALRSKAPKHQAARTSAAPPAPQESSPSAEGARASEHVADSHPDAERSAAQAKAADAKSPDAKTRAESHTSRTAAGDAEPPVARIPNIDVNAVTRSMTEKAKARVDSVGRTITVKPPTFDKPKPSQP